MYGGRGGNLGSELIMQLARQRLGARSPNGRRLHERRKWAETQSNFLKANYEARKRFGPLN